MSFALLIGITGYGFRASFFLEFSTFLLFKCELCRKVRLQNINNININKY